MFWILLKFSCLAVIVASQECGVVKYTSELIFGGQTSKKGAWPWLVALHDMTTEEFFCGSTLVSDKHILTAAHCFWSKGAVRQGHDETNTFVVAGKYDLRYFEANAQKRNLAKIVLHPDWKPHATNFDADIAIATTEYAMYFTNLVQPICLPNFNAVLIHPLGTVVGWGRSEKTGDNKLDHENLPKEIEVKAVTNEECFLHYDEFAKISSPRTFCAGWPGKNIGPCHGDSGGGFYYKVGNRWFIQGIVSATVIDNGRCDVSKYSVYTNILKLVEWARESMRDKIASAYKDISLNCQYLRNFEGLYGCENDNLVIDTIDYRIANTNGLHEKGLNNLQVEYVWIKNSKVKHLPRFDAKQFYPEIRKYLVTDSQLEFVKRDDFLGFPKMETLNLDGNLLRTIPEDAFYDLGGLVDLYIENNKLTELPEYMLNNAPLFQRFRASNNTIETIEKNFFKNNFSLKICSLDNNKIKSIKIDFKPYKHLKKLDLFNNVCINNNYNDWRKTNSVPGIQAEIDQKCK